MMLSCVVRRQRKVDIGRKVVVTFGDDGLSLMVLLGKKNIFTPVPLSYLHIESFLLQNLFAQSLTVLTDTPGLHQPAVEITDEKRWIVVLVQLLVDLLLGVVECFGAGFVADQERFHIGDVGFVDVDGTVGGYKGLVDLVAA